MIDLEKAKNTFTKYVNKFDLKEPSIERKLEHSFRVMEISKKIATNLKLEKEKIEVATLIGLLHDIGRFEQYTQYKTFSDLKSFDHGDYGVELLEENNRIREFIATDKYDTTIKKAIKNHNKFEIEQGLNEEEVLFSKIIRDADKLDIFYEVIEMFWENKKEEKERGELTSKIKEQFYNGKIINKKDIADNEYTNKIVQVIAFIYDINFPISFEIIKREKYIDRIIDRFDFKKEETKKDFEKIRKVANEYIEKRMIK